MNTGVFRVEEVDDDIITTMVPFVVEDIYGGDDRVFEFTAPNDFIRVCT